MLMKYKNALYKRVIVVILVSVLTNLLPRRLGQDEEFSTPVIRVR